MDTIDIYLTEVEARAEHAYRQSYYTEYMRVFEPGHPDDRDRLAFWSQLAHFAAKAARDRVLETEQVGTSATTPTEP